MKIIALLVVLFIPAQLYAQDYGTTLSLFSSSAWGRSEELVYHTNPKEDLLSELLWDINAVTFLGIRKTNYISPSVSLSMEFSARIASLWGNMTDYDWYDGYDKDWTHYSRSDALVHTAYTADLRASFRYNPSLLFHAGVKYDYWEWEDRAWEYEYDGAQGSFEGVRAIDYLQHFLIPYGGVSLMLLDEAYHEVMLGMYLSPLVSSAARDYHRYPDDPSTSKFIDLSLFGFFLSFEGEYTYFITDGLALDVGIHAVLLPSSRGRTLMKSGDDAKYKWILNDSGIGSWSIRPRIGITYRLEDAAP